MKVLCVNSSPRSREESKTYLIVDALCKGMARAGAAVRYVALRDKNVMPCMGCFSCWTKTPGECIQKDDMTKEIFPAFQESNLVVLGTPLYHFTLNSTMKLFIERTLPILQPFFERRGDMTFHPFRRPHPEVILVSVAGFPEMEVFQELSRYARFLFGKSLIAEIYRPTSELLTLPAMEAKKEEILAALGKAGEEIIRDRRITADTLKVVQQPLVDPEEFAAMGNKVWKICMERGMTLTELLGRGHLPKLPTP